MAISISNLQYHSAGNLHRRTGLITFDSSYPTGGETLTLNQIALDQLVDISFNQAQGYQLEYDYTNDKIKVLSPTTSATSAVEAVNVTDDDSAASNGVAVYVHTTDGRTAWFEFVSPTNADATFTLNNGGSTGFIFDSDAAATNGVALYFDEDAANADERLLVASPSGQDLLVPVPGANKFIRLKHNAAPGTPGVQVYCDEDGSNSYERLLFVSPTNADGTANTDDAVVPFVAADLEVASTSDLSSLTVEFNAIGY